MARPRKKRKLKGERLFKPITTNLGERTNEYGVPVKPYRISNKTVWLTDAEAARRMEEIEALNKEIRELSKSKLPKTIIEVKRNRIVRKQDRIKERAGSTNYHQTTEVLFTRLPQIVEGMKQQLKNGSPYAAHSSEALTKFINTFNKLDTAQKMEFYEQNADLFTDMSDYYNYLKQTSGVMDERNKTPKRFSGLNPNQYEVAASSTMGYLQARLDDFAISKGKKIGKK
jgi:hypothetical protein